MDNNLVGNLQDADNGNKAGQATEDSLCNPIIVRMILENSSSPQLLKLSLVNKLWKCEARKVLEKRGCLIAHVKTHNFDQFQPTGQIDAFISDLKQMNPILYTGISLDIYFEPYFSQFRIVGAMDPLQEVVFDQSSLKLNNLSVRLQGRWLDNINSPGVLLTKKLLQHCSETLEVLSLLVGNGREDFLEKVVQDSTFPCLKILKMGDSPLVSGSYNELVYESYLKAMLSRAPNLRVLCSEWSVNLLLSVLEGRSVVPVYTSQAVAPFYEISENAVSWIKLENIKLVYTGPEFNLERFTRITPVLLQQSCTSTLQIMRLDAVLAVPLMSYGFCLKNIVHLDIEINYSQSYLTEPRILSIVKCFDFTRIFPNLNKVAIDSPFHSTQYSPVHLNTIIQQARAVIREPMPDRAANIKALHLHQSNLSSLAAQFFGEMFPNIQSLELVLPSSVDVPVPFGSIWKNWLDLKELTVLGYLLRATGNLDSVFCGIFREEVAELRLKDDEYLQNVHIVPVMPAITCLKNLMSLSLYHTDPRDDPFGNDATFMFSKVTTLLAFGRQPDLTVNLNIAACVDPPAMTHLEPYVSVTSYLVESED